MQSFGERTHLSSSCLVLPRLAPPLLAHFKQVPQRACGGLEANVPTSFASYSGFIASKVIAPILAWSIYLTNLCAVQFALTMAVMWFSKASLPDFTSSSRQDILFRHPCPRELWDHVTPAHLQKQFETASKQWRTECSLSRVFITQIPVSFVSGFVTAQSGPS